MSGLLTLCFLAAASPSDLVTASPDAPALELGWRGSLRAKGGGRIRFLGDEDRDGAFFEFPGFIELHNKAGSSQPIPSQYWRGRFALEGGYRWRFEGARPWTLRLTGALEHESDHPTGPIGQGYSTDVGFVNLNSMSVTAAVRHGLAAPTHAVLIARFHVLTCTRDPTVCGPGGGLSGDRGLELSLSLTQELALWGPLNKWALFGSIYGQLTQGTALIFPARRVSLRFGAVRQRRIDAIAVFFQAQGGTDVGYFQQASSFQLGAGIAWTTQ